MEASHQTAQHSCNGRAGKNLEMHAAGSPSQCTNQTGILLCRLGLGVKIDALAGTDERPKAAKSSGKAGSHVDTLAITNALICGLSAAGCVAVLAAGVWTGDLLAFCKLLDLRLASLAALVSRHNVSGGREH